MEAHVIELVKDHLAVDRPVLTVLAQRWFVLHTRSRQEKALARTLEAMGCEHFLPLVKRVHYYGKRKTMIEAPLFPGYLFLYGCRDQAFAADRTGRIAQLIEVADQEKFERDLDNIRQALAHEVPLDPYPYLQVGIAVVVRAGPLKGMQGLIESRARADRLILQVDVLGQALSLEIDASLLDPIG